MDDAAAAKVALLVKLGGIGNELATVLVREGLLFRSFTNRKEVAAYAGLTPMPFASGERHREQGISQAGNPLLRKAMVELAPPRPPGRGSFGHGSAVLLTADGSGRATSRAARCGALVHRTGRLGAGTDPQDHRGRLGKALARKLLVALWRYVTAGLMPEGARVKAA